MLVDGHWITKKALYLFSLQQTAKRVFLSLKRVETKTS